VIQKERIRALNHKPRQNRAWVVYWMQAAQRADFNHALDYAIRTANASRKSLVAVFALTAYPEANLRHYQFMLEGLAETQNILAGRGIELVVRMGKPVEVLAEFSDKADMIITDDGYLRIQRDWRKEIAETVDCAMVEVITNVIVPVQTASDKENFSAGTLRPRIHRQLQVFLTGFKSSKLDSRLHVNNKLPQSLSLDNIDAILKKLNIDRSVPASKVFLGGPAEASKRLKAFISQKLDSYGGQRNDPSLDIQSHLSPYLHFGQISPLEIALAIADTDSPGKDAFLEELIVRRELAFNYVWYNRRYDEYNALPNWAINTLNVHAKDKREYRYTLEQFENVQTHDPAWNAAQMEMVLTGKMHNYMRMYWGKKILEWTRTPRQAFEWALYLNNKYQLDGRDPNSFAGVAWCFGKHDRPWGERAVFGKVRYMNYAGLKRKFDPVKYIDKVTTYSNGSEIKAKRD